MRRWIKQEVREVGIGLPVDTVFYPSRIKSSSRLIILYKARTWHTRLRRQEEHPNTSEASRLFSECPFRLLIMQKPTWIFHGDWLVQRWFVAIR